MSGEQPKPKTKRKPAKRKPPEDAPGQAAPPGAGEDKAKPENARPAAPRAAEPAPESEPSTPTPAAVAGWNIHKRVYHASTLISNLVKADRNTFQGYRYVSHDDVVGKVREAFILSGILATVSILRHDLSVFTTAKESKGARTETLNTKAEIVARLELINPDDPADRYAVDIPAYAFDTSDKALGKAVSYAKKYALIACCGLMLATGDDADRDALERAALGERRKAATGAPEGAPGRADTPAAGEDKAEPGNARQRAPQAAEQAAKPKPTPRPEETPQNAPRQAAPPGTGEDKAEPGNARQRAPRAAEQASEPKPKPKPEPAPDPDYEEPDALIARLAAADLAEVSKPELVALADALAVKLGAKAADGKRPNPAWAKAHLGEAHGGKWTAAPREHCVNLAARLRAVYGFWGTLRAMSLAAVGGDEERARATLAGLARRRGWLPLYEAANPADMEVEIDALREDPAPLGDHT